MFTDAGRLARPDGDVGLGRGLLAVGAQAGAGYAACTSSTSRTETIVIKGF